MRTMYNMALVRLKPYHPITHTVEDSIYVCADRLGTGLGKLLMPALNEGRKL